MATLTMTVNPKASLSSGKPGEISWPTGITASKIDEVRVIELMLALSRSILSSAGAISSADVLNLTVVCDGTTD